MSALAVSSLLRRYGKPVYLLRSGSEVREEGFAVIQAKTVRGRQFVPSPLGMVRCEEFLYLGEASLSLIGMEAGTVFCDGITYDVLSAQAVYLGQTLSYWHAVLQVRDEVTG